MADIVRIVDSISASPTVLLDLNDETSLWVRRFSAPPPRLRRSVAQNALRDGDYDAASSYNSRVVEIDLESIEATQDAAATTLQTLFRLLDTAAGKFLQYQPQGASKPVFFVLRRSDTSALVDAMAQAAMRSLTLELNAEPFALGLQETLGPYTVNNDPAAVSNPGYVDITGVLGDVAAPVVYWDSTAGDKRVIVAWATDTPLHIFRQAESMTLGTDTANPGGGPSATFSGTGTNNHVTTTFTVSDMTTRLTWTPSGVDGFAAGRWRVLAFVALTSTGSGYAVRGVVGDIQGESVDLPSSTSSRVMVDLGVFTFGDGASVLAGHSTEPNSLATESLELQAGGPATTTLRWDCVVLLPAGEQADTFGLTSTVTVVATKTILDGIKQTCGSATVAGDPVAGTAVRRGSGEMSGAFPTLRPGTTNRVFILAASSTSGLIPITSSVSANLAYWPQYLFVRPSAS